MGTCLNTVKWIAYSVPQISSHSQPNSPEALATEITDVPQSGPLCLQKCWWQRCPYRGLLYHLRDFLLSRCSLTRRFRFRCCSHTQASLPRRQRWCNALNSEMRAGFRGVKTVQKMCIWEPTHYCCLWDSDDKHNCSHFRMLPGRASPLGDHAACT